MMSVDKRDIWKLALDRFESEFLSYYRILDSQFLETSEYVFLSIENAKTYSLEFSRILLTSCAEIDVFAKAFVSLLDDSFKPKKANITKWGILLQEHFPDLENITVDVFGYGPITPWGKWAYERHKNKNNQLRIRLKKGKKTPFWWTSYNNIKHERGALLPEEKSNFSSANQKNALYSLAALYILENLFLNECARHVKFEKIQISELFKLQ